MSDIREATVFDTPAITEMWVELMRSVELPYVSMNDHEKEKFFLTISAMIKLKDTCVLVSEDEDGINGIIYGKILFRDYGSSEPLAQIDGVYSVAHTGMELIDKFTEWAEGMGVRHLIAETVNSERLMKIWTRKGYKPVQITYYREV